jgi:hypothetical protein
MATKSRLAHADDSCQAGSGVRAWPGKDGKTTMVIRLVLGSGAIVQVWLELRAPIQATAFSFVSLTEKDNRSPHRKLWQKAKSDYRTQYNDEFQFWR